MIKRILFIFSLCLSAAAADNVAVTIALIPESSLGKSFQLANEKTLPHPAGFRFDESHLPHLTLFQKSVRKQDLPKLLKLVKEMNFTSLELESGTYSVESLQDKPNQKLLSLGFAVTDELRILENQIVKNLSLFAKVEPSREDFFTPPLVFNQFIEYVSTYQEKKAKEHFKPHVTVGIIKDSEIIPAAPKLKGKFNQLKVLQLGNFGTARKNLGP